MNWWVLVFGGICWLWGYYRGWKVQRDLRRILSRDGD